MSHTLSPALNAKLFNAHKKRYKNLMPGMCNTCRKLYGANVPDMLSIVIISNVTTIEKYTIVEIVLVIHRKNRPVVRHFQGLATKSYTDKLNPRTGLWIAYNRAFLEMVNMGE